MTKTGGKYAYDRHYYENLYNRSAVEGNTVKRIDYAEPDYEEEYTETTPELRRPEREYEHVKRPVRRSRKKTSVRYTFSIDLLNTLVLGIVIFALVYSAFTMLEVKSDITQMNKQIAASQNKLDDIESLNDSLRAGLDTEVDRNYIYSVACQRFGMVYPDKNQIVYYTPATVEYVRQYTVITEQ